LQSFFPCLSTPGFFPAHRGPAVVPVTRQQRLAGPARWICSLLPEEVTWVRKF